MLSFLRLNRKIIVIGSVALLTVILCLSGVFYSMNMKLADYLYQEERAVSGEVIVVGIDQRALEEIGPLPWDRSVMAKVIMALNEDAAARPAVIGIDVLYAGKSTAASDELLVKAVREGENVVLAGAAVFGEEIVAEENGDFYIDSFGIKAWDEPFAELKAAGHVGHINAMFDRDGVMRHHLLWIDTPFNERVYSFGMTVYQLYCEKMGIKVDMPTADKKGFLYLPYSTKPGGLYESISVWDILSGEIAGYEFEDRIVLIGPYDASLQDNYRTPISTDENMFGVEIQGNMVNAALEGKWYTEVPRQIQRALLVVLCLFSIWLFSSDSLRRLVVSWLCLGPLWICLCLFAKKAGYILDPLYVPLSATLMVVFAIALNYISASLEKRRITQTFQKYVAPSVVDRLLKEGHSADTLGGELVDIAVLFVDIRGFTPLSEALDPRQIVEILNEYLSLTTDCIMETDGTLDKFVGDCTMAFWNAPLQQEDYVYKACKAAMEMVSRGRSLGDKLEARYGRRVDFGIGVNVGAAVVGNIGAPKRMDFTAIGDTVNTAARLEANAPAGKIYISRAVAEALGERCSYISLGGSVRLKGKAEGFEVLELTELK